MGRWFLGLFLTVAACMPSFALAIYYNNTEIIEIGDGVPPPPGPPHPRSTGAQGYITNPPPVTTSPNASSTNPIGETVETPESQTPTPETQSVQQAVSSVISLLESSGALSGSSILSASSTTGIDESNLFNGGIFGSSGYISISGQRARQALRDAFDLKDFLHTWRTSISGPLSAREYGIFAASTAVRDVNVENILFSANAFEITYRSRGYLFSFIPWSFPVHLTIIPESEQVSERVKIKLPWYRFFIRKFFTVENLSKDIDAVVLQSLQSAAGKPNQAILIFDAVAEFLRKKVGTLGNTILLGD